MGTPKRSRQGLPGKKAEKALISKTFETHLERAIAITAPLRVSVSAE
jgi:hypothetical protein